MRYAEDANYFTTTVHPAQSQGEISAMLEDFGATSVFVMTGNNNGNYAWMIRFQWEGRAYRFTFVPLTCENPDKMVTIAGKKRTCADQARYQMGRIAVFFVKAILTAAEATPAALFGFLELPGVKNESGIIATAAEVDVSSLVHALPDLRLGGGY
jgi:hypothetical protein